MQRLRSRARARHRWWCWLAATATLSQPAAHAEPPPDAGALLRETQRDSPQPPPHPTRSTPSGPVDSKAAGDSVHFSVRSFQLEGASLVPEATLQSVLAPWLDRTLVFSDLERASDALVEAYRQQGFYVRVQLPPQDIDAGVVRFELIEARLGAVTIEAPSQARIDPAFVRAMFTARLQPGQPLGVDALERASALLGDTPGVQATVSLVPGRATGETDLRVGVRDAPLVSGLLQADNQGARSTGSTRLGSLVSLDDPSGRGDQLQFGTSLSEGSRYARLAYGLPAGDDGWRLGAEASLMHYRLLNEFSTLDASGDAQTLALTAQYPILRGARRNLRFDAGLEQRFYRDRANAAETDRKRLATLTLGLSGDATDERGGGGTTFWGLTAGAGRVDLGGNAASAAADLAGPHAQGRFAKLGWRLGRVQRLGDQTSLWVSLSGQFASRNLDSSEKLSLGGPYGVRAYPALEGTGDSGGIASVEMRQALGPQWQAIAFLDAGVVRRDQDAGYAGAPATQREHLAGYGLGLAYGRAGGLSVRATLATRLGSNPLAQPNGANADGSRGALRAWVVVVESF